MKKILHISLLFFSVLLLTSSKTTGTVDKEEAKKAFDYLNQIRQNPKNYSKEIGSFMRSIKPMPVLIWNDTLAQVAEEKALDMAEKDYFAHINKKGEGINVLINRGGYSLPKDFYKKKTNNFFESIATGQTDGVAAINDLIRDKGINPPAHRQHLLGLTPFWAECFDIGIGFIRTDNPQKPTYICIIIARHTPPEGMIVK
jgi:uncharacterized protein YkwD